MFDSIKGSKSHSENVPGILWIVYYYIITYAYCIAKLSPFTLPASILYFFFYFRAVPFLWYRYGMDSHIPAIVFLFEEAEAVISSTLTIVAVFIFHAPKSAHIWIDDILAAVSSIVFAIALSAITYVRKSHIANIGLAELSLWKYFILIAAVYFTGNLENSLWYGNGDIRGRVCSMIAMVFVLLLTGLVIFVNGRSYSMEAMMSVLDSQMSELSDHYLRQSATDKELRSFSHEAKNHLTAMRALLESKDYDRLESYLNKLSQDDHIISKSYNTGNPLANAILSYKSDIAKKADTEIIFDGIIPALNIQDCDLVILLSNILDNAIEACAGLPGHKQISFTSRFQYSTLGITVTNPVRSNVLILNNRIDTSKSDKLAHGIGISNMERIARKYQGDLFLSCDERTFTASAILNLSGDIPE